MLHFTRPDNVSGILECGLSTDMEPDGAKGLDWVQAFYETSPFYLTTEGSDFTQVYGEAGWSEYACIEVDTTGLPLVADIPSLVDKGARYDTGLLYVKRSEALAPLVAFADEYGWIEIEHLVDPRSDAAAAAIRITGTAACLSPIAPDRIGLRPPAAPTLTVSSLAR